MEPNSVINYLNYDYSLSSRMVEEQTKGFGSSREQDSPLKGRFGQPFQYFQIGPSWASATQISKLETTTVPSMASQIPEDEEIEGLEGLLGPKGYLGPIGTIGEGGDESNQGPSGPTGPDGIEGKQGTIGPRGDAGFAGGEGTIGDRGEEAANATGPRGDTGPGPSGPTGPGITGDTGVTTGETGIAPIVGDDCGCCITATGDDVWVAFPDPNFPSHNLDPNVEGDEQVIRDSIIVGETHSFVLYFIRPDTGNKQIFFPLPNTSGYTDATWTYYNDFKDETKTITTSYSTHPTTDWGDAGGFLAEDVRTDFSREQCEQLKAYRRGIGEWPVSVGNEIDGYGVCGCEEIITDVGSLNAVELHAVAHNALDQHSSDGCANSMWGICGWDSTLPDKQFWTNSKGRFIVGSSIDSQGEPVAWHGWKSNGFPYTKACIGCEGCESMARHVWPCGNGSPVCCPNCCEALEDTQPCYGCDFPGYGFFSGELMEGDPDGDNCFTIDPELSGNSNYYNPLEFGVSSNHPAFKSGLWVCNSNPDWGTHYDAYGNLEGDDGPAPRHGIEYGQDSYNWSNCMNYQCCSDPWGLTDDGCEDASDACHWLWDRGIIGCGRNWQGKVMLSDQAATESNIVPPCAFNPAGSSNDIDRTYSEAVGYFPGVLIYRPGSSHTNGLATDFPGQSGHPLQEQYARYIVGDAKSDIVTGGLGPPAICIAPGSSDGVFPGEYAQTDYLPCKFPTHYVVEPLKPFPTLVMNGKTIADKLKDWLDDPILNPDLEIRCNIDVGVMVLTNWQVQSPVSAYPQEGDQDYTPNNEPWPFWDPWPDQAPTRDYEEYFHDAFGCDAGTYNLDTHRGCRGCHTYLRQRATWHCRVGGMNGDDIVPHRQKTIQGDGAQGVSCSDFYENENPHWYARRRTNTSYWKESNYCIGHRLNDHDDDDGDHWITHGGNRVSMGSHTIGLHGYFVPGQSTSYQDIGLAACWDSLDNGVNVFMYFHWIDGVMRGETHTMPNAQNVSPGNSAFDGDHYYWHYLPFASGPWKYKINDWNGQDQAVTRAAKPCDEPGEQGVCPIMRMEQYLNEYFDLPDWSFDIDYNWKSMASFPNFYQTPDKAPSYMSLTDYTITSICVE